MKNRSAEINWVDRVTKRFNDIGILMPPQQRRVYEAIRDHWCSGRTVVDIGCGTGTGSNILSHTARHVWGVDINKDNINYAVQAFARPNMDFSVLDIEVPPTRELANFEVITCVEVIEHLESPEIGLGLIKRFMSNKLDSKAFITIPNINNEEIKKRDAENELHLHRWTPAEFYDLLIKHFKYVTMYSADKVNKWTVEETVGTGTKDPLLVIKLEAIL